MSIEIAGKQIGGGESTLVIAEIGQAHDGSVNIAHSFVDAVADAGADAIKFQTHLAKHESTLDEPFRADFSKQDDTRYEYWERMEFTKSQWEGLAEHTRERGLVFLSSAFCQEAVDLLQTLDVPAWKVGSGEYRSKSLVSYMAETGLPVLLSTGMSKYEEIEEMVALLEETGSPYALFQCTSIYPTELSAVGLNVVEEFRNRYSCPIGLSDHTGSIHPSLAAISRGVDLLELHVTFDRDMFGPDAEASVTVDELEVIVDYRDELEVIDDNPVDKDEMAEYLSENRDLFTKSIAPKEPLPKGAKLTEDRLTPKKPGTGIPYEERDRVIGETLKRGVSPKRLITWEDINGK